MASGGSKTVVLRVSIHCEGCKKKVKKIMERIDGVDNCEVDSLQSKVTVTGDVDANVVLKKLLKYHKQAELWPEKKPNNPKEQSESSKNDSAKPANKSSEPTKPKNEPKKNIESSSKELHDNKEQSSNQQKEANKSGGVESGPPPQSMYNYQNYPPPSTQSMYNYQNYPPPPAYMMSYNMAQPSSSHAYFAPDPEVPSNSQDYTYPSPAFYYGQPGSSMTSPEEEDSYDLFNDENPNSCQVM